MRGFHDLRKKRARFLVALSSKSRDFAREAGVDPRLDQKRRINPRFTGGNSPVFAGAEKLCLSKLCANRYRDAEYLRWRFGFSTILCGFCVCSVGVCGTRKSGGYREGTRIALSVRHIIELAAEGRDFPSA
ncbi:hypothetical protein VK792_00565 [Mesobacterium sp. TK19101]|uniref:Uncharacterized protein n=1 Tax=Mesobacterium hydrothermale TaxID=3111907 RepID=A0ABU6HFB1_9RHOB|nr:hypothetical protein [Mesobacterium sp. TK19101]MEC3859760.1 hypothetical protein [Mesobacterium sp. TK19101]